MEIILQKLKNWTSTKSYFNKFSDVSIDLKHGLSMYTIPVEQS